MSFLLFLFYYSYHRRRRRSHRHRFVFVVVGAIVASFWTTPLQLNFSHTTIVSCVRSRHYDFGYISIEVFINKLCVSSILAQSLTCAWAQGQTQEKPSYHTDEYLYQRFIGSCCVWFKPMKGKKADKMENAVEITIWSASSIAIHKSKPNGTCLKIFFGFFFTFWLSSALCWLIHALKRSVSVLVCSYPLYKCRLQWWAFLCSQWYWSIVSRAKYERQTRFLKSVIIMLWAYYNNYWYAPNFGFFAFNFDIQILCSENNSNRAKILTIILHRQYWT